MTPAPQLLQLIESFVGRYTGVAFHPDDPHRAAIEAAAAQAGLAAVADPAVDYRAIRGCTAPVARPEPAAAPAAYAHFAAAGAVGPGRLPVPPPPGVLVRSEWDDIVWAPDGHGDWVGTAPNGTRPSATWEALASGTFGPIVLLVPVPVSAGMGSDEEFLSSALDQLMGPVIDAMEHLGAAAVSGFRALLGDAVRRGERRAAIVNVLEQGLMSPGVEELLAQIQQRQRRGDA